MSDTARLRALMHDMNNALVPLRALPSFLLGKPVEEWADRRIPILVNTPAAVRFISAEPLLGPLSLRWLAVWGDSALKPREWGETTDHYDGARKLDWVIVGGESGSGHRPIELSWLTDVVDQCREAGIACFVKQDSGPIPGKQGRIPASYWVHDFPLEVSR